MVFAFRTVSLRFCSLAKVMQLLTSAAATAAILASSVSAVNFTGDVLNGVAVIHDLNLADVPAQKVSRYYLRVGELNGGHPVHIPVMVARGTPCLLYTSPSPRDGLLSRMPSSA